MDIPAEFASIPGYVEALRRENNVRDAAMLNLNTRICGVEIQQMTLRHWIILDGIGSPLLGSGIPFPEQVIQFLWVLSPKFNPSSAWRRLRFIRACRGIPYGQAVLECRKFVEETFQDAPPSQADTKWTPPQVSFAANVIYVVASVTHWPREAIVSLPIKEAFQYLKLSRMANSTGPAAAGFNPSDIIKIRAIRAERERRKLQRERAGFIGLLKSRLN